MDQQVNGGNGLGRALHDMASPDTEVRVLAVEQVTDHVARLAQLAVDNLEVPGRARPFVAERLSRLGSVGVAPLESLLKRADDPEVQLYAAIVLLQLGSTTGMPILLHAVTEGNVEVCLAAVWLARTGLPEAKAAIQARLDLCTPEDASLAICLVSALSKLGAPVPNQVRQRFLAPDTPRDLRTLIERLG
jgi:hypothetical protein